MTEVKNAFEALGDDDDEDDDDTKEVRTRKRISSIDTPSEITGRGRGSASHLMMAASPKPVSARAVSHQPKGLGWDLRNRFVSLEEEGEHGEDEEFPILQCFRDEIKGELAGNRWSPATKRARGAKTQWKPLSVFMSKPWSSGGTLAPATANTGHAKASRPQIPCGTWRNPKIGWTRMVSIADTGARKSVHHPNS